MDPYPEIQQVIKEMEAMGNSIFDLDFIEFLESDMADSLPLPLHDALTEECGPQQPQAPGAAPLSPQQQVLPEPGFQAAQTDFPLLPLLPPYYAPPMYQPPTFLQPDCTYYRAASLGHSQFHHVTVMSLPQGFRSTLAPVGTINGERQVVYGPPYTAPPVAPVVKPQAPPKRKYFREPEDESRPYITKPPNAFMIFRMEQRPKVVLQLKTPSCGAVNRVIGQTWNSLSKEEQAKYYHQADNERELHSQRFPDWSAGDNYGMKKKRGRRKVPAIAEDSAI